MLAVTLAEGGVVSICQQLYGRAWSPQPAIALIHIYYFDYHREILHKMLLM